MLGLLLKVNFSQEKLSLYSLMLVFDTMGTSSPEMVPAVGGKAFVINALTFGAHLQAEWAIRAKTYHYKCIITLTSQSLVGSYHHGLTSFNFSWADRAQFYLVITSDLYLIVKETCGKKATDSKGFGMMSLMSRTKSSIYTKLHKQMIWLLSSEEG